MSVIRQISVLSLCTLLLSSCDYLGQRLFDEDRTVPDGGQNGFGARHVPVLNPGGALYRPDQTPESSMRAAENPYMSDFNTPSAYHRQGTQYQDQQPVPAPASSGGQSALPAPAAPVAMMPAPAQKVAVYTPVRPATTTVAQAGYPALSSTPPNPVRPSRAATRGNIQQMETERDLADAARQEMVNNQEVQSMQRDAASVTPAPVIPATPAPKQTSSDSGFSGWLNRTFSSEPPPAPVATQTASSNWKTLDNAAVSTPAPVIRAPMKTASTMKPLEPIHLVPPSDVMGTTSTASSSDNQNFADNGSTADDQSIDLTPPSDMQQGTRYLSDNRYTARRMRATQ